MMGQALVGTPAILALKRLKQEGREFKCIAMAKHPKGYEVCRSSTLLQIKYK
jgi:hypothetical protein